MARLLPVSDDMVFLAFIYGNNHASFLYSGDGVKSSVPDPEGRMDFRYLPTLVRIVLYLGI